MTSAALSCIVDDAIWAEGTRRDWLQHWLHQQGLVGIMWHGVDADVLAQCIAAEFEGWCEERGIDRTRMQRARRIAMRALPLDADLGPEYASAARDAAAWRSLRQEHLATASL